MARAGEITERLFAAVCLAVSVAGGLVACGDDDTMLTRVTVGPEGATVRTEGIAFRVPPGALGAPTEIEVWRERAKPEGLQDLVTPVFRLEPEGLTFAQPVLVNLEVPDGVAGRLYWSRSDNPREFEPIGYIENGRAAAYVRHFSRAVGSRHACSFRLTNYCSCRASDGANDILCKNNPASGEDCAFDGFPDESGTGAGSCQGWSNRPLCRNYCDCRYRVGGVSDFLCPVMWQFRSMNGGWRCGPEMTDVSLMGFHEGVGNDCVGWRLVTEGTVERNVQVTGRSERCAEATEDHEWVQVDGQIEPDSCWTNPKYPQPGGSSSAPSDMDGGAADAGTEVSDAGSDPGEQLCFCRGTESSTDLCPGQWTAVDGSSDIANPDNASCPGGTRAHRASGNDQPCSGSYLRPPSGFEETFSNATDNGTTYDCQSPDAGPPPGSESDLEEPSEESDVECTEGQMPPPPETPPSPPAPPPPPPSGGADAAYPCDFGPPPR